MPRGDGCPGFERGASDRRMPRGDTPHLGSMHAADRHRFVRQIAGHFRSTRTSGHTCALRRCRTPDRHTSQAYGYTPKIHRIPHTHGYPRTGSRVSESCSPLALRCGRKGRCHCSHCGHPSDRHEVGEGLSGAMIPRIELVRSLNHVMRTISLARIEPHALARHREQTLLPRDPSIRRD